jgi:hypothetical protein
MSLLRLTASMPRYVCPLMVPCSCNLQMTEISLPPAQNAKNYEANTGKSMNIGGGESTEEIKGAMKKKAEEPAADEEPAEAS